MELRKKQWRDKKLVRYKNQYGKLPEDKGVYSVDITNKPSTDSVSNKQNDEHSSTAKPKDFDSQMEEYLSLHSAKPTIRRKKRRRAMAPSPEYVTAGIGNKDNNKGKDLINRWFKKHKPPRHP